jgi:hypothetical protein
MYLILFFAGKINFQGFNKYHFLEKLGGYWLKYVKLIYVERVCKDTVSLTQKVHQIIFKF